MARFGFTKEEHHRNSARYAKQAKKQLAIARRYLAEGDCRGAMALYVAAERSNAYSASDVSAAPRGGAWNKGRYARHRGGNRALTGFAGKLLKKCVKGRAG